MECRKSASLRPEQLGVKQLGRSDTDEQPGETFLPAAGGCLWYGRVGRARHRRRSWRTRGASLRRVLHRHDPKPQHQIGLWPSGRRLPRLVRGAGRDARPHRAGADRRLCRAAASGRHGEAVGEAALGGDPHDVRLHGDGRRPALQSGRLGARGRNTSSRSARRRCSSRTRRGRCSTAST